jgi:hypothetical protein
MADAHAAVEGRGAEPERTARALELGRAPEAHVVALLRAPAHELLEGEVLAAAFVVEVAHRRVRIGPVQQHARDDLRAGLEGDRVRG